MLTRRGLITGLVSFLAAPAIVRASSLMDLRGVPLDLTVTEILAPNELAYGYVITRQTIENKLYPDLLADITDMDLHIEEQPNLDVYHVTGPKDAVLRSWRRLMANDKLPMILSTSALPKEDAP